nr:hypothetical protein [Actinoplanes sp. ATCC 53533]
MTMPRSLLSLSTTSSLPTPRRYMTRAAAGNDVSAPMVSAGAFITSTAVPRGHSTCAGSRRRHQPTGVSSSGAARSIFLRRSVQETMPSTTSNRSTIGTAVICRSVSRATISATDASWGAVITLLVITWCTRQVVMPLLPCRRWSCGPRGRGGRGWCLSVACRGLVVGAVVDRLGAGVAPQHVHGGQHRDGSDHQQRVGQTAHQK